MVLIDGIIHPEKDKNGKEKRVSLTDVIAQVRQEPAEGELVVRISSIGGYVDEGFRIHNYLRSIGRPIKTIAQGECMSIATIIFLAGDVREISCSLMIHNPWIKAEGDSSALKFTADLLAQDEKRMEKFYSEKTGLSAETLSDLMKTDRIITKEEAVALGFATVIREHKPLAIAYNSIINDMTKEEKEKLEAKFEAQDTLLDRVLAKVGLKRLKKDNAEVLAMDVTTASGDILTIEREGGDPQVGDNASPDGEWLMPDGTTIVVSGGVITEIRAASAEGETDLAKAQAEIERLKTQLKTAQASKRTQEDTDALNAVKAIGGIEKLREMHSKYVPEGRKKVFEGGEPSAIAQRVQKIKEERENPKK